MSKAKRRRSGPPPMVERPSAQSPSVHSPADGQAGQSSYVTREAVESIVIAILLALLFRGFEAEAFIIPTGSMAPTLQGRHRDICCPQCGYQFRAGAAQEAIEGPVVGMVCPLCRFESVIDNADTNDSAFNGDRILVNKFIYEFTEPRRWDVIVFKFPGNAKQNYIKRLVGLPDEELNIRSGDVFTRTSQEAEFEIARKPASKLPHMLHTIYDSRYIPSAMAAVNWPTAWVGMNETWQPNETQTEYSLPTASEAVAWLRYRNLLPEGTSDWSDILQGRLPNDINERKGSLVSDFYAYNAYRSSQGLKASLPNWVGDLAGEAVIDVEGDTGELWLELVEGGHKLNCVIDVATGIATATIDGGQTPFSSVEPGVQPTQLTAQTSLQGRGSYRLMWANADDRLYVWVNREFIDWSTDGKPHTATFTFPSELEPHWSADDPQDLMPVAIGAKGVGLRTTSLRVYRDVYYIAAEPERISRMLGDYTISWSPRQIDEVFRTPELWADSRLFRSRRQDLTFKLAADQYFPMGDNSPQSRDARLWGGPNESTWAEGGSIPVGSYVERRLLIGKAFLVYWPHGWYPGPVKLPIAPIPNLDRMGRIR